MVLLYVFKLSLGTQNVGKTSCILFTILRNLCQKTKQCAIQPPLDDQIWRKCCIIFGSLKLCVRGFFIYYYFNSFFDAWPTGILYWNINWNISDMEDRMQEFRRRISSTHPPQLGYHHPKTTDDDEKEKKGKSF